MHKANEEELRTALRELVLLLEPLLWGALRAQPRWGDDGWWLHVAPENVVELAVRTRSAQRALQQGES